MLLQSADVWAHRGLGCMPADARFPIGMYDNARRVHPPEKKNFFKIPPDHSRNYLRAWGIRAEMSGKDALCGPRSSFSWL